MDYDVTIAAGIRDLDDVRQFDFGQFEGGEWAALVEADGDFKKLGAELPINAPVDGFTTFWRDIWPIVDSLAPDDVALHAPLRFVL